MGCSSVVGAALQNWGKFVYPTLPVSLDETHKKTIIMPGEAKDPTQEVNV